MRAGGTPGPTRMLTSPPAYLRHQGSTGPRLSPTYILFVLWRALFVNRSILLIQIIRKCLLPLVTRCSRICRLSRPYPGNDDHLLLCFIFTRTFVLTSYPFSAQAKLSKRAKKNKPVEESVVTEPEIAAQEPPAASTPEATAPTDKPIAETSANLETSSPAQPADDPDVVITRTEFVEPGRPTALAKCSAKGELLQPHRVNLDLSDYANLSIGELVSGYISQVHKSRDAEVAMVNQIQQKSEVSFCCPRTYCIVTFTMLAPKSTTYT